MHKVKTLNNISDKGLGKFAPDGYELSDVHADPEAIVLRSHKLTANDITPSLMAVGRAGAGVNNVPVDVCTDRGVVVFHTPGATPNAVKELLMACLFLSRPGIIPGI